MKLKALYHSHTVMANYPELESYLRKRLESEFQQGKVDFRHVRNVVSSPRLESYTVRCFSHPGLKMAGDSYLSLHTMVADGYRKTYALSMADWLEISDAVEKVDWCEPFDEAVMSIQVWPFQPRELGRFAMSVAVALSFSPAELMVDSRTSIAVDELMSEWGYYADGL
ncbi:MULTISPECIES: hypothetical protein [Pseudomonas]|uniref:Uncharacterized protein n=1 Tax=Pseudomonas kurunegalensis TaxID=485880 RepID=A0ACC5UHE1_9PSED|nr:MULTISPECIES: hypothetical protein [Pseudomonas]MBC3456003.1 hypothetical protein [Pseudomonas mosselii]MBV4513795.1 hypothetical protein [Pseudomonas kurunegalensis]